MKYYTGNNTGDVPGNLPDPYYCMLPSRFPRPKPLGTAEDRH